MSVNALRAGAMALVVMVPALLTGSAPAGSGQAVTGGPPVQAGTLKPAFTWNAVPAHYPGQAVTASGNIWGNDDQYDLTFWQSNGSFTIQGLQLSVFPGMFGGWDTYLNPGQLYSNELLYLSEPLKFKILGSVPANAPPGSSATVKIKLTNLSEWWQSVETYVTITIPGLLPSTPGPGWLGVGADVALSDLNFNGKPEMLFMAVDPVPPLGPNQFRYKIGWDVGANGHPNGWTDHQFISAPGWASHGGGVAMGEINGDFGTDMVLMMIDDSAGADTFRYMIAWNVNPLTGDPTSFSPPFIEQVGGAGNPAHEGACTLRDIDGNGTLELIMLSARDASFISDAFQYVIGWNLDTEGKATPTGPGGAKWTGPHQIAQLFLPHTKAAGVAFAQLDSNPLPDMIVSQLCNLSVTNFNTTKLKIGWNVNSAGIAASWTYSPSIGYFDALSDGGGIAVGNIDGDAKPEMAIMSYDDAGGPNVFRWGFKHW